MTAPLHPKLVDGPSQHWYIDAQKRKRVYLKHRIPSVLDDLRSVRCFAQQIGLRPDHEYELVEAVRLCPSSCNRQGVRVLCVDDEPRMSQLAALFKGATGWAHNATALFVLFVDPAVYVAGDQLGYMPMLDMAYAGAWIRVRCRELGLDSCTVCPNLGCSKYGPAGWESGDNMREFDEAFNPHGYIQGGMIAVGAKCGSVTCPPKRTHAEVYYP